MAAVFGRLWPSTRVLVGAGLRGEREGGGIRWRRWGFGNGAFARLLCLCVLQSAPVAPRCEQLCALLVADFSIRRLKQSRCWPVLGALRTPVTRRPSTS